MSEVIDPSSSALNEAAWVLLEEIEKYGPLTGHQFNNLKPALRFAIEKYLELEVQKEPVNV